MAVARFEGAWTAMVTPFKADSSVDWEGFRQNVEFQVSQGITGILPVGTTGESPSLDWKEHEEVIDQAIEFNRDRAKVLAGTGSNSTAEAMEGSRHAIHNGADAVLLVDCYYNGPSSLELRKEYYEAVLDAIPGVHVVPYVIPGRTGCELSVEDLAILAGKYPGVHAVKEATGSLDRMRKTRSVCGSDFQIMSGDDDITTKMMTDQAIRATGVISVITNVIPKAVERLTRALLSGNTQEGLKLQEELAPLFGIVTVKAENTRQLPNGSTVTIVDKFRNPLAVKTLMNGLGMPAGPCRRPLGKMTAAGVKIVRAAAQEAFRRNPSHLKPIEDAFGVKIDKRLADDRIWSALIY